MLLLRFCHLAVILELKVVGAFVYLNLKKKGSPISRQFNADNDYYSEENNGPTRQSRRPLRKVTLSKSQQKLEEHVAEAAERHEQALQDPTLLTQSRFADRKDIHPNVRRAIDSVLGLKQMTTVQLQTFGPARSGANVLGRAKTGTGKTLAFLVPAIERLLAMNPKEFSIGRAVGMVVVAPTRELALQIGKEADDLLSFVPTFDVMTMYGGTKISGDVARLNKNVPSILVTTPGRFLDHLEDTKLRGTPFKDLVKDTKIIVLDEADRLLEGFPKDIGRIMSFLPRSERRQMMCFSATLPPRLRRKIFDTMPKDFKQIDCIGTENSGETNVRVSQAYAELGSMDAYVGQLASIISAAKAESQNAKVVVFLPAARLAKFFGTFFNDALGVPVLALHSRMSQSSRRRIYENFCKAETGVLFSSDVSARGVDIPGVSHVVQYGAPQSRELYIHRLGRTGRAGRQGSGLVVFLPFEEQSTKELSGMTKTELSASLDALSLAKAKESMGHEHLKLNAEAAYLAFVAYYMANRRGAGKKTILEAAAAFAGSIGLVTLPELPEKLR